MKTSTFKNNLISLISGIVSLFLIVIVITSVSDNILLPSIGELSNSFIELLKEKIFYQSLFRTFFDLSITLLFAFFFSIILTIPSIKNTYLDSFLSPYFLIIKCSPLAIISVYIYLLNKDAGPYIIIFFATFPIIYESIIAALKNIPVQIKQELALTDVNTIKKYFRIYLPLILPYALSSLILSFSIGLKAAIMGEYLTLSTENHSLGSLIYNYKTNVEFQKLLAILIFCVLFSLIIELLSKFLVKLIKNKYL